MDLSSRILTHFKCITLRSFLVIAMRVINYRKLKWEAVLIIQRLLKNFSSILWQVFSND